MLIGLLVLSCGKKEDDVIKIGAILPLTGTYAQYGVYMKQGVETALEDAIAKGIISEGQVQIIFEDSQANPQKSVDAFNKLIDIDKICAVIPATSAVILALKPIANKNEIVLINATAISPEIEDQNDYLFSTIPNAEYESNALANFAYNNLNQKNYGVLFRNDQSGLSFSGCFSDRILELGGKILFLESILPNTTDFRTQIAKLKNIPELECIFVACFGTETAYYLKQAMELGFKTQVITYETFNSQKNLEIAGISANGLIFCSPVFDKESDDEDVRNLRTKIKAKYNQNEFNFFIASHYDAMMLILESINRGNFNGTEIKNDINKLKRFQGVTGEIHFDEYGAAEVPLSMYTVKNMSIQEIK